VLAIFAATKKHFSKQESQILQTGGLNIFFAKKNIFAKISFKVA